MSPDPLSPLDLAVRGALTRAIAALGHAPPNVRLAQTLGVPLTEFEEALQRLHHAHALLLHPHSCVPWVVHPFSLSPGSCWVESGAGGWWANCLWCGMGIAAALRRDAAIHTRIAGEREPVVIHIRDGKVQESGLLFHLSTPVRSWWDNVIHACASFQPFRAERDIDDWCERHALQRGAVMGLPVLRDFAEDWYGKYLEEPWRRRTPREVSALFLRHGLTGDFWQVE